MLKKPAALVLALALAGCAAPPSYNYMGTNYSTPTEMLTAIDSHVNATITRIEPLPQPLTAKKLVVAVPSAKAVYEQYAAAYFKANGRALTPVQGEAVQTSALGANRHFRGLVDAIKRRGIYPSVSFREMETTTILLEPSADTDVLYFGDTTSQQWFYGSAKYGRQLFAWDLTGKDDLSKVKAFLDAAQAVAMRD